MTDSYPNGSLYIHIQNRIAKVVFGHPAANSFPAELLKRLTDALLELGKNPEVSVILLASEGDKAFCAGASFDELKAVKTAEDGLAFFSGFAHLINAMRTCGKIIIGRAQGKAVGGGVGILAACDYVLAAEDAAIKLSELSIGIGPFVIAPAVARKIGTNGLAELTLAAHEWKNAYWAKQKGLYANVFETHKQLDEEIDRFVVKLASYHPEALSEIKKTLWKNTEHWEELLIENAKISGRLVLSDFTKNALKN
ncbi:MAG: enoyl-CoA hydratase/isomerase family protein [Bacteroidetes bacterium]|nr:enoyl-CoA hydratase/isomerase family protein [Bacteroidota bacterium]